MKSTDYSLKKNWVGYLLVLPTCIAIFCVSIYPMLYGMVIGFQNYSLTKSNSPDFGRFAGLENYAAIFNQPEFVQSVLNTLIWTVTNVAVQVVLATIISLLLNRELRGRGFFRTATLVPWAIPSVIAALTFKFIYDTKVGIFNVILTHLNILGEGISWLGNIHTARWAVILESIWKGTPFVMIFILAALQTVPPELYESARVDGASRTAMFFRITLPMIKEPVAIATILTTIGTINNFNAVWLMTQGGPLGTTEIMYTYAYRRAFTTYEFGEAAAISAIMFGLIAGLTFLYTRLIEEREN